MNRVQNLAFYARMVGRDRSDGPFLIRVTDAYRTRERQARLQVEKPGLAASPDRSKHVLQPAGAVDVDMSEAAWKFVLSPQYFGGKKPITELDLYGLSAPVKGERWHWEVKPGVGDAPWPP